MAESVLAIVGGGRWGQVLLSVVANMPTSFDRIVIISSANAVSVREKVASLNITSRTRLECMSTLDNLFANYEVKAAIVVNAAAQHFRTAQLLIKQGVHVLIEKPMVSSMAQLQILLDEANRHHVYLMPGLNYRFCSYIKNFALLVAKYGMPQTFRLQWSDAQNEMRYGELKRHDMSISVAQDVLPHVWTILAMVFGQPKWIIQAAVQDNSSAEFALVINDVRGKVLLQRHGAQRERFLVLEYDQKKLVLDFTKEPGTISDGANQMSGDLQWEQKPGPLASQLTYFFSKIDNGESNAEDMQCCLDSVACTELASSLNYVISSISCKLPTT